MITDKTYRKHLERQLGGRFSGISLNGFIEIAVGEACSDYLLAVKNGEVIHNPEGWIYKDAKNKILDEIKRLKRQNRLDVADDRTKEFSSGNNFERSEDAKLMLEELLPLISPKKRDALMLHEYEGLTLEETAEKLDISVQAVEWRIREAKKELRKVLSVKINKKS